MSDITIAAISVVGLFAMILAGVHVAFALAIMSFVGMVLLTDIDIALSLMGQTASSAVNGLIFAVIPLFILMGAFMTNSPSARNLYALMNFFVRKIRGGLAVATVFANAAFAAVTGVSLASAAVFSTIAYPQMSRHGYSKRLALGSVAGSSVLGMLIPPSVLLILYGLLAQVSIGDLFLAGIIPGIILAVMFSIGIVLMVRRRPQLAGGSAETTTPEQAENAVPRLAARASVAAEGIQPGAVAEQAAVGLSNRPLPAGPPEPPLGLWRLLLSAGPVALLFVLVIGGIWGGLFTPTEAGAAGAFGALAIAFATGMRWNGFVSSFKDTAMATGSILLLLITAQLYARMLATSGLVNRLGLIITSWALPAVMVIVLFVILLLLLGALLDSSSIILLTVPLMFPIITQLGLDPVWFGIVMVVAVEVGIITPPFGMIPFAMSGILGEEVEVSEIFIGASPFIVVMLVFLAILIAFPAIVTWLPSLS